jgi:hypothetical protein
MRARLRTVGTSLEQERADETAIAEPRHDRTAHGTAAAKQGIEEDAMTEVVGLDRNRDFETLAVKPVIQL